MYHAFKKRFLDVLTHIFALAEKETHLFLLFVAVTHGCLESLFT